jgi:hypothetical protein
VEPSSKPTNIAEGWYKPADGLTVAVMLKHSGPKLGSLRDYAFEDVENGAALVVRRIFACAGVRTANRQTRAVTASLGVDKEFKASGIYLSFPGLVDGKPLIEKLEFRLIANQSVFETTFYVNPAELFDGTETVMYIPSTVDEPTPVPGVLSL